MATGRNMMLTKQAGEYLVASELAKRGLLVAAFSGNVPDFDLLAADQSGSSIPVQVKTIRGGAWQFSADSFVSVTFEGETQLLGKPVAPHIAGLMCVLVVIKEYGKDRFFVLTWEQLRERAIGEYSKWLEKHGNVRPRKAQSLHCSVLPKDLMDFEGRWDSITSKLPGAKG